ncbi:MAG: peroxiredoxin-like family protein [Myxococcota bacterium]
MFCRERAARFADHVDEIRSLGAEIHAVGNGTPHMARDFASRFDVSFPLWTDPSRQTYRALGMKRAFGLGLKSLVRGRRAMAAGHRQGRTQGDPWQQGGAVVITPRGEVIWSHVDEGAGEEIPVEDLLDALRGLEGEPAERSSK